MTIYMTGRYSTSQGTEDRGGLQAREKLKVLIDNWLKAVEY